MVPAPCQLTAPVPPPAYQRAVAKRGPALHIDALALVTRLHVLALCRLAVQQARRRCSPPLPQGPGGAPRRYSDESLLLIALLHTLWRLSPRAMTDWLRAWPALAFACGLPARPDGAPWVPCPSQQWKRAARAGAPPCETLFVLVVKDALRRRVIGARDLIIDSAPIKAWRRADARHPPRPRPRPSPHRLPARLPRPYPTLPRLRPAPLLLPRPGHRPRRPLCPALARPGRRPLQPAPPRRPPRCRVLGPHAHRLDPHHIRRGRRHPLQPQSHQRSLMPPAHVDQRRVGQARQHRALLRPRLPLLPPAAPAPLRLVGRHLPGRPHLHCRHRRRARRPRRRPARPHPLPRPRPRPLLGGSPMS